MKLKNILNIVKNLIFSYMMIFLLYNCNILFRKLVFSSNDKIIFLSKTIIISLIIINIILYFKDILFRKKRYLFIIILFILSCNFAEGYFSNFKSYTFIIAYIYILLITFYNMLKRKYKFEISLVYSFSIILLSAFVIGMFGLLFIFKYVLLVYLLYVVYYIYKRVKNDKQIIKDTIDSMFDVSFIVLNIMFVLAILFGAGLYVHVYDEYSHWAFDAKSMIYYSKFGTSQDIMLKTKAYPPIFTVWHYILSIFEGFNEHYLYVGLNFLISIYLMPLFIYIKNNNLFIKILGVIAIIFGCYMFGGVYSYNNLYADYAITSIFTCSLIVFFISKDQNINLKRLLIILLIILTLSKTNGFVIAFIFCLIVMLNELISLSFKSFKELIKKCLYLIKKYKSYILAIIITFLLWKLYLLITGKITVEFYDAVILPDGLKPDLKFKLNYEFINSFLRKVLASFDSKCIWGLIPLTLYQYLIVSSIVIYLLFYKLTNDVKKALLKIIPFILSYLIFFFVTVLSIFFAFCQYEASILASFERYLNWYNVAILLFIISIVLRIKDNKSNMLKMLILGYIVLSIPFSSIYSFAISPIKSESYNAYVERSSKVKFLNDNTSEDSLIYVIDQKDVDGIMAMWYTRYYAFPRKNNASSSSIGWKIKTQANKDDLRDWGLTVDKWEDDLKKYGFDYVFLYSVDDLFFEKTKYMYDDYESAKEAILFKIEYDDKENIKLIAIK